MELMTVHFSFNQLEVVQKKSFLCTAGFYTLKRYL